ncbi:MAG: PilZ domain-containing protein [Terriglobia bacterium]
MKSGRQQPRAPILTQVEVTAPNLASLGRAHNLSVGGILIDTPETLPQGVGVVVHFFVPPDMQPMEVAGRVVRSQAGKSMAIAFLGLPESYKQRILAYIQGAEKGEVPREPSEYAAAVGHRRRSARIPRRIAVVLTWQDEAGKAHQEAAETSQLSRYGALLTSYGYAQLEPGQVLRLRVPERGDAAGSRVVYTAAAPLPGRTELAIEIIGAENFWGVSFPADSVTLLPTRRRSARLQQTLPVDLSWETSEGVWHREATETCTLSQYGVRLTASDILEAGRLLQVRQPDTGRLATARIVWRAVSDTAGRVQMGLEFLGSQDFWGIVFPADRDYVKPGARFTQGPAPAKADS